MNITSSQYLSRIHSCREWLSSEKLDGMVLPVTDAFLGEYVPLAARRLEWLTGFNGSAGMLILLQNTAALCTDGRYILQARSQLKGLEIEVVQVPPQHPMDWLQGHMPAGRIGYDPWLHSVQQMEGFRRKLAGSGGQFISMEQNPVDMLWKNRPQSAREPAEIHPLRYAGQSAEEKRQAISCQLKAQQLDAALLTAPDSICWLLNIRGRDVPRTPFLLCYAVLNVDGSVELFANASQLDNTAREHLGDAVAVYDFSALGNRLGKLGNKRVLLDALRTPAWFTYVLEQAGAQIVRGDDPCQLPKAVKNATEIAGTKQAHQWDGVALCRFLAWLERTVPFGQVTELSAAQHLKRFRMQHEACVDLSFTTISGSGSNGAIVHYGVSKESNRPLQVGDMYLVDSGGQYREGTTDVTRTVSLGGKPTDEQKRRFTQVLKGHIALARATFPKGTGGGQLDVLARYALWQDGVDYAHGTGHGVGSFLSVHEGPQRISAAGNAVALQPGMILSNEPGFYKPGEYGIRIENLVLVTEWQEKAGQEFYRFETLTLAPIDRYLVDVTLLDAEEVAWLDAYHARVYETIRPLLEEEQDRQWLHASTMPLS